MYVCRDVILLKATDIGPPREMIIPKYIQQYILMLFCLLSTRRCSIDLYQIHHEFIIHNKIKPKQLKTLVAQEIGGYSLQMNRF